jgi:hypothetical protein
MRAIALPACAGIRPGTTSYDRTLLRQLALARPLVGRRRDSDSLSGPARMQESRFRSRMART